MENMPREEGENLKFKSYFRSAVNERHVDPVERPLDTFGSAGLKTTTTPLQ